MSNKIDLFTPVKPGAYELPNRIVMAPLTRMRSLPGNIPQAMNAIYYTQRSTAGLIISEATQVAPEGLGYPGTPGIHSPEQIEGWKLVTNAVHQKGGKIFLQLWHVGRISHPSLQPDGKLPIAPSAIAPEGEVFTYTGLQPFVTPRAIETAEIPLIIDQFYQGAKNALLAGFDGVEIHAANGYLLDQFLQDGTNQRTDEYGGSFANRMRLIKEITTKVIEVWGADKVGIRLSPSGKFNSMYDSNPEALFTYIIENLNPFNLAYLHLVEPRVNNNETLEKPFSHLSSSFFRPLYKGTIISAGGYDRDLGNQTLANGEADLIAYGRLFISNPDLPLRFAKNSALNPYDSSTFYGGDERGYIDYPSLDFTE
jgi:N-ethylmaleimide reductase